MAQNKPPSSYVGNPSATPGKPVVQGFTTPNLDDRVYVMRVDSRKPNFSLPDPGDAYIGPNAEKFGDYQFATAKPCDQIGWYDFFFVNERENQNDYNFEVSYPWADRNYPQYTRTYVVLRDDTRANEPQADEVDPVHSDLLLVDHKWTRLQDPVLDALFIGVQRIYQRLPSPILTDYEVNQVQQVATILTQEVPSSAPLPTPSATTEVWKTESNTIAKSKVTTSTVDEVFPDTRYQMEREDRILPFKFRTKVPMETDSHIEAGTASVPVLGQDDWTAEEHQTTEFKKFISRGFRSPNLPVTLIDYRLDKDQRLVTITDTWDNGLQTITPTTDTVEASVTNMGNDESILSLSTVDGPFPSGEFTTQISDPIPEKFRITIPVQTTALTSTGTAALQSLSPGELEHTEVQQTDFWKRVTSRGRDISSLPISFISYKVTKDTQLETITETLDTGLQDISPFLSALLLEGSVDNLGNSTSLLTKGTVSEVFDAASYSTRIPDVVPERFKVAVPVTITRLRSAGTASPPVLGTGDLSKTEEQETEFIQQTTTETRAGIPIPVTLISYKVTKDKQIETVRETYDSGLQTLGGRISALTVEADVQNLGNDTSLKTIGTVSEVFAATVASTEVPDLVPDLFKAILPTNTTEVTSAGQITNPPVLASTEFEKRESQIDVWTKRVYAKGRTGLSLPTSVLQASAHTTEEYGGGIVLETAQLTDSEPAPDEGLVVVESKVTNLGNGSWLLSSTSLDDSAWPILASRLWDDNMRVEYDETKQVVAAGTSEDSTSSGQISEVKAIDKWRSMKVNISKPLPGYVDSDSALVSYEFKPYRFPGYVRYSGFGYYVRAATAVLTQHTIRTWWGFSSNPPTSPMFNEIITADVIINNLANTGLEYARNVLHDGFFAGVIYFPPTTPTASEYALGNIIGSTNTNLVSLYSPGQGYSVGSSISFSGDGGSYSGSVTQLGLLGSIRNYSPITGNFGWTTGSYGPYTASGGSPSAQFIVTSTNLPTYDGSAWIGTPRVIAASVTPEKEKDLWKFQTESVIMR